MWLWAVAPRWSGAAPRSPDMARSDSALRVLADTRQHPLRAVGACNNLLRSLLIEPAWVHLEKWGSESDAAQVPHERGAALDHSGEGAAIGGADLELAAMDEGHRLEGAPLDTVGDLGAGCI